MVTLLEVFEDSDAGKLRVENLLSSPLAEPFQNLFEPTSFTVLGSIKDDLREMLEGRGRILETTQVVFISLPKTNLPIPPRQLATPALGTGRE